MMNSEASSDVIFLRMPHIFKPLQVINALILAVCVGAGGGGENGILWFIIFTSLIVSALATAFFMLKIQDSFVDSISNGSLTWPLLEMIYSFIFAILSATCIWISFGVAGRIIIGSSGGYVAAGLFFIVHTALYAVPCAVIYDQNRGSQDDNNVQIAHPFNENSYQYDV